MVKVNNMPRTQLSEKLGSNGSIFDHSVPSNVHRSRFDLSYKKMFTADIGMIMPIDLIRTLPGDDFEISIDYMLDTLPMVAPPMTNYRVTTHWYYCRLVDLWEGAETFITRGRSGSIDLEIPKLNISAVNSGDSTLADFDRYSYYNSPQSLECFLGLPPLYYNGIDSSDDTVSKYNYLPCIPTYLLKSSSVSSEDDVSVSTGLYAPSLVNALPFFMYQKIYRQNYLANNLLQDNKVWFPDNLSETWRVNYGATNLFGLSDSQYNLYVPTYDLVDSNSGLTSTVPSVTDTAVNLLQLRYAMWKDDYFTSALPWSTRGTAPTIDTGDWSFNQSDLLKSTSSDSDYIELPISNYFSETGGYGPLAQKASTTVDGDSVTASTQVIGNTNNWYSNPLLTGETFTHDWTNVATSTSWNSDYYKAYLTPANLASMFNSSVSGSVSSNITANTLRNLIALSVWQERNARTNGNYNATIFAHFRVNPHSNDYEPKYIGGTADYIQFTKVIQTSATDVDNDSYLGSEAGLGSSRSQGFVGKFHCNDYGYIMGVMIITPEVSYSGGVDRLWFETSADEQYFPEYASLGLQEIYNKEIYVSEDDETQDNDLFGYQERYTYYKTRRNQVSGLFSLTPDSDMLFSAYVQNRYFDSLPELSQQFVTMSPMETRRDFLAYPSQPAFRVQLANKVFATRALPYQNVPQTFGF